MDTKPVGYHRDGRSRRFDAHVAGALIAHEAKVASVRIGQGVVVRELSIAMSMVVVEMANEEAGRHGIQATMAHLQLRSLL
ncbi:MAG: hypothetical protein JSS27_01995 [Planctomycetes bacterium]|nr:hypothetical protein [Planctomycetota bacterium]